MEDSKLIIGIGELLWDLLPDGEKLGGAPANFAYHAAQLGNRSLILSRVGNDEHDIQALTQLRQSGLSTDYIQIDERHPTGTVNVQIDTQGQPAFIVKEGAWDWLEFTPQWRELATKVDAVCFGSLAQRSIKSRGTIHHFLEATSGNALKVFDVNLRQSFFSKEILRESMEFAQIIKVNNEELPRISEILGSGGADERSQARRLLEAFELELVCVTRGARGSLLVNRRDEFEHCGFPIKVHDAVGAGDSFTAALVNHYLRGASLENMSEAANRLGSWVATQTGGMPEINREILKEVS